MICPLLINFAKISIQSKRNQNGREKTNWSQQSTAHNQRSTQRETRQKSRRGWRSTHSIHNESHHKRCEKTCPQRLELSKNYHKNIQRLDNITLMLYNCSPIIHKLESIMIVKPPRTSSDVLQDLRTKTFHIQALAKVFHLSTQSEICEKYIKFDEYDVGNIMDMIVEMGDRIYELSCDLEGQIMDCGAIHKELRK